MKTLNWLFISNNKVEHCMFGLQLFCTNRHFHKCEKSLSFIVVF